MKFKKNNISNDNQKDQSSPIKTTPVRWIIGGLFIMFALVNGFHYSSLFLLGAAFLMFPLQFVETFLQKKNIKTVVAIILSVALFFLAAITSPPSDTINPNDEIVPTTQVNTEDKSNDSTKPNNSTAEPISSTTEPIGSTTEPISSTTEPISSTTEPISSTTEPISSATEPTSATTNINEIISPDNTTNDDEKVEMVWISSSGKKYHSKSTCSGMKSPSQISLDNAIKQGYTACKKCH